MEAKNPSINFKEINLDKEKERKFQKNCLIFYKKKTLERVSEFFEKFDIDAKMNMSSMNKFSTILYKNFKPD